MKKLISVLFAALLLAAVLPLGALADSEEKSVTFTWNGNDIAFDNSGFYLIADSVGESGWPVGSSSDLIIMDDTFFQPITRIVAEVSAGVENCGSIEVDYGVMQTDGNTVTVTNINNTSCLFTSNNTEPVQFSKITVYYTSHKHTYDGNGICSICHALRCDAYGHDYAYICRWCGEEASGGTASTLSEGNLAIITAVAGVAFGFLAAMVIFKKKKPALASGENTDEE